MKEGKFAIKKIIEIKGNGVEEVQLGDMSLRPRLRPLTPEINPESENLIDLIDWCSGATEPPPTCSLTTAQVKQFVDTPMSAPDCPSHTQSIERCVQMVTEASGHVYSQDRREGYIRSQIVSRKPMIKNRSKKDMHNLVDFGNK